MFDTHMHTKGFSSDSNMDIEDAIKFSKKNNIQMIITEHMDLKFPKENLFNFDPKKYFDTYSKYRNDDLLLGIEIGMKDDCIEENRTLIKSYPFDYVIGSVHLVDNIDIYGDEYYINKTKIQAYNDYLKYILKCMEAYDFIDSMGHIDYISRYAKFEDKELYYEEYKELIDEVLKSIIRNEKCMEINTRRLNEDKAFKNMIKIYERFSDLGGKYVTLGSDSHRPEAIGSNFKEAMEIANICNLKPVYFKNRKMEYEHI